MFDYKNFFVKLIGLIGIILAIFATIYLGVYFLPFMIAGFVAMFIEPAIAYLYKKYKSGKKIIAGILVFLFYGIIGSIIILVCFRLFKEATNLLNIIPNSYDKATNIFEDNFNKFKNVYNILPDTISSKLYDVGVGLLSKTTEIFTNILSSIFDFIKQIPAIAIYTCVTILATYFIATDRNVITEKLKNSLPENWYNNISNIIKKSVDSLACYIKAQLILASFTFVGSVISFLIIRQEYPFTLSLLMALLDILPILGIGAAFLPWAVYCGATGNISKAVTLLIVYIILISVRQVLEPKVVSSSIGIKPIITLFAMFFGFKLFGFLGLIFGPIIAIILKDVLNIVLETGYIKSMFMNKNQKMIRYFKKYE